MIHDSLHLLAIASPEEMIRYGGLALICAIVFIETGLLLGIIIPGGDSLLFTAGLLCATNVLETNIYVLIPLLIVSGILGDLLGYIIGRKMGRKLFERKDSWIFKKKHLEKAEEFYKSKGKTAIIAGKFVPVIRTFNPLLAGVTKLDWHIYLLFTTVGTTLWICTLVLGSYLIGKQFPQLQNYMHFIIPIIILISLIPLVIKFFRPDPETSK